MAEGRLTLVRDTLPQLDYDEAMAVELVFLEGRTVEWTAWKMKRTVSAVQKLLEDGIGKLRSRIHGD